MMRTEGDSPSVRDTSRRRSASLRTRQSSSARTSRREGNIENVDLTTESSVESKFSDVDRMTAPLPLLELACYFFLWTGAIGYACYDVYQASARSAKSLAKYYDFEEGWSFIQRKRDPTNFEWEFYRGWFLKIWPWFIGHAVAGLFCRRLEYKSQIIRPILPLNKLSVDFQPFVLTWARVFIFMLYGMVAIGSILGLKAATLVTMHCLLMYVVALSQEKLAVWAMSIMLLSTITLDQYFPWLTVYFNDSDSSQLKYYLLNFSMAMTNIRITSFCLELVDQRKQFDRTPLTPGERRQKYMLFDLFVYVFYLPLYFTGPIMTFDQFDKQLNAPMLPWTSRRITHIVKEVLRIAFWCVFVEFVLYFFYFNAMKHDQGRMQTMPLATLGSIGWMHMQFFMLKYVVMFGIPRIFAQMDQFDPPEGPKCISRIATLTVLWRTFDRGLHEFAKRHIYIPLGGSHNGPMTQIFAILSCFTYIWFWHGAEEFLFIWAGVNFLGLVCEVVGAAFMNSAGVKKLEERALTPAMGRRMRALAIAPITMIMVNSAMYFLGGKQIGLIYTRRLLMDPVPALCLFFLSYCCAQISIAAGMNETDSVPLWVAEEVLLDKDEQSIIEPSEGELKGSPGQHTPMVIKKSGSKNSVASRRSSRSTSRRRV